MAEKNQPTVDDLRAPLLAAVGAADLALERVNEIVAALRERADEVRSDANARAEERRARISKVRDELPAQFEEIRGKLSADELRRAAGAYADAAQGTYTKPVERGAAAGETWRTQPAFPGGHGGRGGHTAEATR